MKKIRIKHDPGLQIYEVHTDTGMYLASAFTAKLGTHLETIPIDGVYEIPDKEYSYHQERVKMERLADSIYGELNRMIESAPKSTHPWIQPSMLRELISQKLMNS